MGGYECRESQGGSWMQLAHGHIRWRCIVLMFWDSLAQVKIFDVIVMKWVTYCITYNVYE
jgi:hypothetical protein